ncbi:hypothetical protein [Staphylococcus capitis]|uniref:hypothetical protein n=1 Tax=Staphylococcus capitis TaxID=29388 RepID=UPI0038048158
MRKIKRSFYVNELYNDKLKMIQRDTNKSTLSSSIGFLIDYYIKNENKKNENKDDENHQKIIDDLSYIKKKLNGADFNILVALHMLSDISDSDQVTESYMVPLEQTVNQHYKKAYEHARHYLANRREF